MKYETIPTEVEAHQQQLVSATVHLRDRSNGEHSMRTANPGDWIVKWPEGQMEVFTDKEFREKFREPPAPFRVDLHHHEKRVIPTWPHHPQVWMSSVPANPLEPCVPPMLSRLGRIREGWDSEHEGTKATGPQGR